MDGERQGSVRVVVFGPLVESLGSRTHKVPLMENMSIEDIIEFLGASDWIAKGLTVALNNAVIVAMDQKEHFQIVSALLHPLAIGKGFPRNRS